MPKSKSFSDKQSDQSSDLGKQQRIQETKQARTTTGPGETSVSSSSQSSSRSKPDSSNRSSQSSASSAANDPTRSQRSQQEEPGDLNEV